MLMSVLKGTAVIVESEKRYTRNFEAKLEMNRRAGDRELIRAIALSLCFSRSMIEAIYKHSAKILQHL
jgi:hypothetical protein